MPKGHVTDTELAVLKLLWEQGPSTIRSLADRLYPGGEAAHYATVQKLLERLRGKSCVRRRKQGRSHVYVATVARPEIIDRSLRETADKLCEGSLAPLLTQLLHARDLSAADVASLRELVARLESDEEGVS
jgi:BlaI family transcriptional regulator, penicillinase repressor